jgi:hypothetical protein
MSEADNIVTLSDLKSMADTVTKSLDVNKNNPVWIKAFKIFNDAKKGFPLQMGCRHCYVTVYHHHLAYYNALHGK